MLAGTRAWLERAVIGLELCPFAKAAYVGDRIRFAVSAARNEDALLEDLTHELSALHSTPEQSCETTLLIHPRVLGDFMEYNVFLDAADRKVDSLGLRGEIQIASELGAGSIARVLLPTLRPRLQVEPNDTPGYKAL